MSPSSVPSGRRRIALQAPAILAVVDMSSIMAAVAILTLINLVIIAVASVGAVEYTESNRFCGQLCPVPMQPEYTAHQAGPHAKVACVSCHVAPGASGAVTAKMNGTRQVYRLVTGTYSRPIPSPREVKQAIARIAAQIAHLENIITLSSIKIGKLRRITDQHLAEFIETLETANEKASRN